MTPVLSQPWYTHAVLMCLTVALPAGAQAPSKGQTGGGPSTRSPVTVTSTTSEIAALATPATVTILTFDATGDTLGQGSGFLVRSSGVIVTNWHVMAGASTASVFLASGERFDRVEALDGDRDADLALVKVPGYNLPTLTPTANVPPVGAKVVAIGSPHGLARTVTEGIVSARRVVDSHELVQISAPISPGSSGGPVIDTQGRAFAVATSQVSDGQQLNFATPVRYALGLMSGTSRPKSLAKLFATDERLASRSTVREHPTRPRESSGDGSVDEFLTAPAGPRPAAAARLRRNLGGTYVMRYEARWPNLPQAGLDTLRVTAIGLAVIAADHSGLVVRTSTQTRETEEWVDVLADINAAADGRVAFQLGGRDFAGYQTNDGVFAEASSVDRDGDDLQVRLLLRPTPINLAHTNGVYNASAHTRYHVDGQPVGAWTDWNGDLAIVTTNDSIWIDITLANEDGGSTGGFLVSALDPDGRFAARNPKGTFSLVGTVRAGILWAEWTDVRKNGAFIGTMRARRE